MYKKQKRLLKARQLFKKIVTLPDIAPIGSKGFPPGGSPPGIMGLEAVPLLLSANDNYVENISGNVIHLCIFIFIFEKIQNVRNVTGTARSSSER